MSVGFIMYEIVDKDSLKNQGINTETALGKVVALVGYSLKNQGINTTLVEPLATALLDIHLNIKALTPCKSEYDEFQPFITKIK